MKKPSHDDVLHVLSTNFTEAEWIEHYGNTTEFFLRFSNDAVFVIKLCNEEDLFIAKTFKHMRLQSPKKPRKVKVHWGELVKEV